MIDFSKIDIDLCDEIGQMFVDGQRLGYDAESFIKTFMNSNIARYMDKKINFYQWAGKKYLIEALIDENNNELKSTGRETDEDILYWIGYVYRFWHYYTGETSKEIYIIAPFRLMRGVYLAYHTLSVEMAIDRLKEAYESKNKA